MPYEFSNRVAECATLDAVQEAFGRALARHGFSQSAVRQVVATPSGAESQFVFRNWSGEWARKYPRVVVGPNNFSVNEAQRRTTPFTWKDVRTMRSLTPGEAGLWDELRDFGWCDGFVMPVHGPRGYLATVSMASMERDLDWSPAQRLRLQMIALATHERARALADPIIVGRASDSLTPRELECLRWVADGKTDWEIGMILSISAATVKFHLDGARVKLRASTRAQAVARLVLRGLH